MTVDEQTTQTTTGTTGIKSEPGDMIRIAPANQTNPEDPAKVYKEWGQQAAKILSDLPDQIGKFISNNQRPIISLGLIFGGIVTLKLTLAILDAINDIPLLAPTFELVGIGYTAWFVSRYLLKASDRQELSQEIDQLKARVVGKTSDS